MPCYTFTVSTDAARIRQESANFPDDVAACADALL